MSNDIYEILEDIESSEPRIERINQPHTIHSAFNSLIRRKEITKVLRALLGPNVRMQNSKLNLKLPGGSAPVEWHQDWAFYPHTNDDVLAVGVMVDDMTEENGPIMFVPGSHKGPIYDHLSNGYFCGAVTKEIAKSICNKSEVITGPAGSVTFHHVRLLHGSKMNTSLIPRRFLLYEAMAADAWPLAGCSSHFHDWDDMVERMIMGQQTTTPRLTNIPVRMPQPEPPVDRYKTSIFALQREGQNKYYHPDDSS